MRVEFGVRVQRARQHRHRRVAPFTPAQHCPVAQHRTRLPMNRGLHRHRCGELTAVRLQNNGLRIVPRINASTLDPLRAPAEGQVCVSLSEFTYGGLGSSAVSHFADLPAALRSFELSRRIPDIRGNPGSAMRSRTRRLLAGISSRRLCDGSNGATARSLPEAGHIEGRAHTRCG